MTRTLGTGCPLLLCARLLLVLSAAPVCGASFVFNAQYEGNNVATLAPGSDNPDGASLAPGDDFVWTIASVDSRYWRVEETKGYFALMAFAVNPPGIRTGDFELVLRNDGAEVFSLSETAVETQEVHVGTNTVDLTADVLFDEMQITYTLTASEDLVGDPVDTVLSGLLPIFGAPENNQFETGIVFVPEPATALLAVLPLALAWRRLR